MNQLVHGHTANKDNIVLFFIGNWRRLYYFFVAALIISRIQISRNQTILILIAGAKMLSLCMEILHAVFLFSQKSGLDIGSVPIVLSFIHSTKKIISSSYL